MRTAIFYIIPSAALPLCVCVCVVFQSIFCRSSIFFAIFVIALVFFIPTSLAAGFQLPACACLFNQLSLHVKKYCTRIFWDFTNVNILYLFFFFSHQLPGVLVVLFILVVFVPFLCSFCGSSYNYSSFSVA